MDGFYGYPQQTAYSPAGTPQSAASPAGSGPGTPDGPKKAHQRTYQACKGCRQRKVKCDMGDVENPHPPPCARCARERRHCDFDDTRRKDKNTNGKRENSEVGDGEPSSSRRHGPKRSNTGSLNGSNGPYPGTNGLNVASHAFLTSHMPDRETLLRSDSKFKQEMYDGTSAFKSLIEAATTIQEKNMQTEQAMAGGLAAQGVTAAEIPQYSLQSRREAARLHWSRFKYVRSGLMSAKEAMQYVDYFYNNCMPFTPICVPDYRDPALHGTLLEKEPFLLLAILTIASRFMQLTEDGPVGQVSRPQKIHDKVFKDTQMLLHAIVYAQEQFGGGMTGGGKAKAKATDPLHRFGLRSITTVEALLLLCEWAPRALHFPPEDDIELMTPLHPVDEADSETEAQRMLNGEGDRRRDSWLEPAWRCDTMIWMLLHTAKALALEIGLFEERSEPSLMAMTGGTVSAEDIHSYAIRKMKTKGVFWAFYVQTCGRLELIGKMPENYLESFNQGQADRRTLQAVEIRKEDFDHGIERPYPHLVADTANTTQEEAVWFFWQEITAIMKSANQNMFPRKEETRRITRSGEYRKWIWVYRPLLDQWLIEFKRADKVQEPMKTILLIEYEYVRLYIHSLPLQAFVDRAVASTPSKQNLEIVTAASASRNDSVANNHESGGISLSDVRKWMNEDQPYVQAMVESCQHVLQLIGESTIPENMIKHFTVRVYFRIMASAVHLLKTHGDVIDDYIVPAVQYCNKQADPAAVQSFVVGAYADNIKRSFELLQKATTVLETQIVDDVHIGTVFAEMIKTVSTQIEKRLTRFAPASGQGRSRQPSATPMVSRSPAVGGTPSRAHLPPQPNFGNWEVANINGNATPQLDDGQFPFDINQFSVFDPSNDNNMIVMPPPHWTSPGNTGENNGDLINDMSNGTMNNNWIAPDLQPLVAMATNGMPNQVYDSHFGPTLNNGDMLDPYMTDTMQFNGHHGLNLPGPNGAGATYFM